MRSLPKVTPSNCRLKRCRSNPVAPPENSQECIACDALKSQKWMPDWPGRKKRGNPGETEEQRKESKMTIDEAIKELTHITNYASKVWGKEAEQALGLGIEALKRVKGDRGTSYQPVWYPLPSETEE